MRTPEEQLLIKLKENPPQYMQKKIFEGRKDYQYSFAIAFYRDLDDCFSSYMCPGMCDPDCPLNVIHNIYQPFADRVHMCNQSFYRNHPEAIPYLLEEMGYEEVSDDFITQLEKKIEEDKKKREKGQQFKKMLQNYDKMEEWLDNSIKLDNLSDFNCYLNSVMQKKWRKRNEQ